MDHSVFFTQICPKQSPLFTKAAKIKRISESNTFYLPEMKIASEINPNYPENVFRFQNDQN